MKIAQPLSAIGLCLSLPVAMADSAVFQNPANGHSYQRIDTIMAWTQAKTHCDNLGGYLATITSAQEQTFVDNSIIGSDPMWLGGTDEKDEGTWEWITGENFTFANWHKGDPNNAGPLGEDFISTWPGAGTWVDAPNGHSSFLPVLACEWNTAACVAPLGPNGADSCYQQQTLSWCDEKGGTWHPGASCGADFPTVPLAVKIDSFSAVRHDAGQVEIELITASEKNTAKLSVFRAPAILQDIAQIQEICGWDSASEKGSSGSTYVCTDANAPASVVYWPADVENNGVTNNYLEFLTNVQ